ncbi:NACHT domain-containing protein [Plantactinospora sp. WMMB334]|uniref:NACHT domain-containing protein n=1 Tax=Plantactinospora sp. WMMB334 TaxID=3404119 RepID=UPI003B926AA4
MQILSSAAVALLCFSGIWWMFTGRSADWLVDNANVVGGIASVVGASLAVMTAVSVRKSSGASSVATRGKFQDALDHLAEETLRYWRNEAKVRKITTPVPAAVRWRWGDHSVAPRPESLAAIVPQKRIAIGSARPNRKQKQASVLTAGIVTRLRGDLYQRPQAPSRIVILGGAGAGKTTAMLLLLIDILENHKGEADIPIPILLTLSSWNPTISTLSNWIAREIVEDYPGLSAYGGQRTVERLLHAGRIALFLDGLDEMPSKMQGQAITEIDRVGAGFRIVLSSRGEEYQSASRKDRLWGAAVIDLLSVEPEHAREFLLAEQVGNRRLVWENFTTQLVDNPTSVTTRTLRSPLALSLARDAYRDSDPKILLDTELYGTSEMLLQHLLRQVFVIAYPSVKQRRYATYWLAWIASRMTGNDLRWPEIGLWVVGNRKYHPNYRHGPTIHRAAAGALIATALSCFVPTPLPTPLTIYLAFLSAIVGALACIHLPIPETYRIARLNLRPMTSGEIGTVLAAGAVTGFGSGVLIGSLTKFSFDNGYGFGFLLGFGIGFPYGAIVKLLRLVIESVPSVNTFAFMESYRADRNRALVAGLICAVMLFLLSGSMYTLLSNWRVGLIVALPVFVTTFAITAKGPSRTLAVAEIILALRGRRVKFMTLLQKAHDRQVLRQAGPVYQFRHALLQEMLKREGAT